MEDSKIAVKARALPLSRFSYNEMTRRNIGFLTQSEQDHLQNSRVFVVGTGGMGGACLQALVRAGVGEFEIADMDSFEVSNLNRQVFATLEDVGCEKSETTRRKILEINPEAKVTVHGPEWLEKIDEILSRCKTVINGMDDIYAGIALYRKARFHGAAVIDAYTSPLPSVVTVLPHDPRPEERLHYPSVHKSLGEITPDMIQECKLKEIEYVMTHSSSAGAVDLKIAAEMVAGKRSRMSFAPMVIMTGNLMAYEAIALLLGKRPGSDFKGFFFNPKRGRTEKPRNWITAIIVGALVRRFLRRMIA